jgi:hypothetical protein
VSLISQNGHAIETQALTNDNESYVRNEEEADREALRILKKEGITVPPRVLLSREKVMMNERAWTQVRRRPGK